MSENPLRSPTQIEVAAKDVWAAMLADCKKNGLNPTKHDGVDGYFLTGSVSDYARKLWPRTNFRKGSGKTAMNMIRQFLRGSGNVVVLGSTADRRRSRIFVALKWKSGTAVTVFTGSPSRAQVAAANKDREARRREAKVTPEEAGETLSPAPVEVKEGVIVHPEYGEATKHPDIEYVIRYANGMCQCQWPGCGRILKPQGVFSHVASHRTADKDEGLEFLQKENERLNQAVVSQFDPNQAMDMVRTYIGSLRKALDVATDNITELEMEVAHLKETQEQATEALDSEVAAKVDLIREVMTRFQNGEVKPLRLISDVNDILEA